MSVSSSELWYRIEPSTGMPFFGLEGSMTFRDWERTVNAALEHPDRRPGRMLSDRRRMAEAHSSAFIQQIVDYFERRGDALGPTRWAVLTAEHDAVYGMVRMAQILAEPTRVQVEAFTELNSALAWLMADLDEDEQAGIEQWIDECVAEASRAQPAQAHYR